MYDFQRVVFGVICQAHLVKHDYIQTWLSLVFVTLGTDSFREQILDLFGSAKFRTLEVEGSDGLESC